MNPGGKKLLDVLVVVGRVNIDVRHICQLDDDICMIAARGEYLEKILGFRYYFLQST